MNLFWDGGELGVAQVWKLLRERRPVARNTVQTTLTRLAEKGWLAVRSEGNAYYFGPRSRARRWCGGWSASWLTRCLRVRPAG